MKLASASVARLSSAARISRRRPADPLPVAFWISVIAASRSAIVSEGSAAGVGVREWIVE